MSFTKYFSYLFQAYHIQSLKSKGDFSKNFTAIDKFFKSKGVLKLDSLFSMTKLVVVGY